MALTKPKQSSFDFTTSKIGSDNIKALGIETASFADLAVTVDKANITGVSYPEFDDDVALLGFKVASNGSLGKYNLIDQTVDAFEDASGVDASTSTGEYRDATGKYYSAADIGDYSVETYRSTFTVHGDAHTDTAIKKFGTASAQFDGSGDYISIGPNDGWVKLGDASASWTIEFWAYITAQGGDYIILDARANTMANGGWSFYTDVSEGGVGFDFSNGSAWGTSNLQDPTANTLNQWYHYAIVQVGGSTLKMYRNGTEVDSTTTLMSDSNGTYSCPMFLGGGYNNGGSHSGNYFYSGYVDDLRISNIARYTANFSAPTAAFTRDSNTLLLMHMNGANNGTVFNEYWTSAAAETATEYLVVAGGGSGGGGKNATGGGGGGAGGYRAGNLSVSASTDYMITVGKGGAGVALGTKGNSGTDSIFSSITSAGGGGAGGDNGASNASKASGIAGGSGGGGAGSSSAASHTAGAGNTPSTSPAQGFPGGVNSNSRPGSGGGGASEAGTTAGGNANNTGVGGDGSSNSISGSAVVYAGGGGGGNYSNATGTPGGSGGGGTGGIGGSGVGLKGTSGLGGGGGGGAGLGPDGFGGGAGGTGIVIIKSRAETYGSAMTLVSTATTAQAAPTKGDMVMTYSNSIGTAVINTDITAEFSADNGSTWTAMTLASQGTTGGHTILSAHDVTRTSTSGTSMRYRIKTLNQSSSKATRIHAVSLGWS